MKKEYKILIASISVLILAILCSTLVRSSGYSSEQEILAQEIGIKIDDYPYPNQFPVGYFAFVLKEGMEINDVHEVIKGYTKVFKCSKAFAEVYYYFSDDDTKALRFSVHYDMNLRYIDITSEDSNSHTISLRGCTLGLFE
jgi:hypothetical protein